MATNFVEELLVGLGFEFEGEDGERFKKQADTVASTINKIAVAAGVATAALFAMSKSSAATNDELAKNARSLDTSAKALSGWRHAANLAGVGGEEVIAMLAMLREQAQAAARGEGGPFRAYSELGVDFQSIATGALDVNDALAKIIQNAQSMDRTLAQGALRELGIDVRFLDMPIDQIESARLEGEKWGGVTQTLTDNSEKFNDQLARMMLRFDGITNALAERLLPAFVTFIDQMSTGLEWVQTEGLPILDSFIEKIGGWENALVALGVVAGLPVLIKSLTTVLGLVNAIGKGMGKMKVLGAGGGTGGGTGGGKGGSGVSTVLGATLLYPLVDALANATIGDTAFAEWAKNTTLGDLFSVPQAQSQPNIVTPARNSPFLQGSGFEASAMAGSSRSTDNRKYITNTFNGVPSDQLEQIYRDMEQRSIEADDLDTQDTIVR